MSKQVSKLETELQTTVIGLSSFDPKMIEQYKQMKNIELTRIRETMKDTKESHLAFCIQLERINDGTIRNFV